MNNDIENGGPAFPMPGQCVDGQWEPISGFIGLTARDYFAARALQGLLAHHGVYEEDAHLRSLCTKKESRKRESSITADEAAEYAYAVADAMLRAGRKITDRTDGK